MTIAVFVPKSKYISIVGGISKLVDKHNDREEGERDRETHSPGLTTSNGWESTNLILQLSNLISNIGTSQFLILFTVFWCGINAWYKQKCLQHLDAHHLVCLVIQIGVLVTQQLCVVLVFIRSSSIDIIKLYSKQANILISCIHTLAHIDPHPATDWLRHRATRRLRCLESYAPIDCTQVTWPHPVTGKGKGEAIE